MNLIKCPRCDLNYIREDEEPALPGKDVCLFCLREMNKSNSTNEDTDSDGEAENVDTNTIGDMDDVSGMDEIIPEVEEDDSGEYDELNQEMSLEDVREDEEREAEEDEEDEV